MEDQNTTPGAKRSSRRSTMSATSGSPASPEANDTTSQDLTGSDLGSRASEQTSSTGQGGGMVARVRERASAGLSTQKDRATEGLGSVAQAVRQSTERLREQKHDTAAQYVEQAADQIDRLTNRLRQKDVGELVQDAQRLARRRPALFIGGAFALGLVGARFLKSSPPDEGQGTYEYERSEYRERTATGRPVGAITGTARDPGTEMH
jgi:hypothetical protein